VAETGETLSSAQLSLDVLYLRSQVVEAGFEAYACVPLMAKGKVVGTLDLAARNAGLFDQASLNLLTGIGRQIGVAIENARLHQQVAQLAVLEERQRIGMDLHDGVIQSIYAVGLTLEYARGQLIDGDSPGADERIQAAMEALNTTIRDIRAYILDLRPRRFDGDDLVEELRRLLAEFKANTLMIVEFNADPAANDALTSEARRALFLIAQESLSNAARHSRASRVEASLVCAANTVQLTIVDNGRGFDPTKTKHALGHGLSNMRDRAQAIGGEVSFVSPPNGGTAVHVSVPRVLSA
jgi:signal transduction histidine kinase